MCIGEFAALSKLQFSEFTKHNIKCWVATEVGFLIVAVLSSKVSRVNQMLGRVNRRGDCQQIVKCLPRGIVRRILTFTLIKMSTLINRTASDFVHVIVRWSNIFLDNYVMKWWYNFRENQHMKFWSLYTLWLDKWNTFLFLMMHAMSTYYGWQWFKICTGFEIHLHNWGNSIDAVFSWLAGIFI